MITTFCHCCVPPLITASPTILARRCVVSQNFRFQRNRYDCMLCCNSICSTRKHQMHRGTVSACGSLCGARICITYIDPSRTTLLGYAPFSLTQQPTKMVWWSGLDGYSGGVRNIFLEFLSAPTWRADRVGKFGDLRGRQSPARSLTREPCVCNVRKPCSWSDKLWALWIRFTIYRLCCWYAFARKALEVCNRTIL